MSIFKVKIPVVFHDKKCHFESFGDWIDLKSSQDVKYLCPTKDVRTREVTLPSVFIDLGISMKLPKGLEANIVPRSSTFNKFGLIQWNHYGVIDHEYCGMKDRWKFGGIAIKQGEVKRGDRICQFRVNVSQRATFWQKLKFLICDIEFVEVDKLDTKDRGGFGSSGK